MKLITFAIPCYNSAEYMGKCIDSLLNAGEDAEILIINDGSTKDNTKEIADKYQEKYPDLCRAIHKENGGHGDAVNVGLKNASGKYFKVVDSDDWLNDDALKKTMQLIRNFNDKESPDAIITNYVYEHTYSNSTRTMHYSRKLPENRLFDFEEGKKFNIGQFISMHSVIYRTQLLRDIGLELPKHTFYVDNIFVYLPLPHVKKFYYLNVDLYRYFIGRPDQSIQEHIEMQRVDQHIRVAKIMIDAYDITKFKETRPKLFKYMSDYLLIMAAICSIFLIKLGTDEDMAKKQELWDYFMEKLPSVCKDCKKKFVGLTASNNKIVCKFCKAVYKFARKKYKFN